MITTTGLKKYKILALLLLFLISGNLNAQCTNCSTQYPTTTQSIAVGQSDIILGSCFYGSEYAICDVVAGDVYTWSTCGDTDFDTQITVRNNDGTCSGTLYGYNDNFCGTQSQVTWTATITGTVRVLLTKYNCLSQSTCMTVKWSRSLPPCTTPSSFTVSASNNSYCPGSNVTISLSNSQPNVSYQLRKNGLNSGTPIAGTGNSLDFSNQTAGTYTVLATGTGGAFCTTGTNMSGSVVITEKTLSLIPTSISGPTSIVAGTSATYTVNGGLLGSDASWKWYTGSCGGTLVNTGVSYSPTINATTTYYVRAEGTCNTTDCITITITTEESCDVIYVDASNGNDLNNGLQNSPVKSLTKAMTLVTSSRNYIKMTAGSYAESSIINLQNGLVIDGRYSNTSGIWSKSSNTAVITQITLSGTESINSDIAHIMGFKSDNKSNWKLIDLNVKTENATGNSTSGNGMSNYAVYIANGSVNYDILRCNIISGNATNGSNGLAGGTGGNAPNYNSIGGAQRGVTGNCSSGSSDGGKGGNGGTGGTGGIGGGSAPNGLTGGNGGYGGGGGHDYGSCTAGRTTTPNQNTSNSCGAKGATGGGTYGGVGGNGNTASSTNDCSTGGNGLPGNNASQNGANGANGSVGIASFGTYYTPGKGINGLSGKEGSGGGGGGGGGEDTSGWEVAGDGGDGGGGGGGGGGAGSGAFGGGGTFAIFELGLTNSGVILSTQLVAGTAGVKGIGGIGGIGGNGGTGGSGQHCGCNDGNNGGKGGNGTKGGNGGNGGDGDNGASAHYIRNGIVQTSPSVIITNTPIVSLNQIPNKICSNSILNVTTSAASWTLPSNWDFVKYNNTSVASEYTTASTTADITTTNTSGFYDITANGFVFNSYLNVKSNRTLPVISVSPSTVCNGNTVNLSATTWGTETAYKWEIFDATNAPNKGSVANLLYSYSTANPTSGILSAVGAAKTYLIRYQVKEECCGWSIPVFTSITVSPSITSSIAIVMNTPSANICIGTTVSFTATPTNGGTTPAYQWKINGVNAGTNNATFESSALVNADLVTCELTSNAGSCITSNPTISNTITMSMQTAGSPLSNTETATCLVNGTNWVRFYSSGGRLLGEVNAQGNDLGNVVMNTLVGLPQTMEACYDSNPMYHTAYMGRTWVMTSSAYPVGANFASNVSVRLPYNDAELVDLNTHANSTSVNPNDGGLTGMATQSNLMLTKITGGAENGIAEASDCVGTILAISVNSGSGMNIETIANTQYLDFSIGQFSEMFLHKNFNNSPLPVTLTNFSANCDKHVQLNWTTASEQNSDRFILEKSRDGQTWNYVNEQTAAGNSTTVINYNQVDENSWNGVTYYRLRQIDFNGEETIYGPISTSCEGNESSMTVYPNPNNGSFTIEIASEEMYNNASLILTDMTGKIIANQQVNVVVGTTQILMNNLELQMGTYLVTLRGGTSQLKPVKVLVK